MNTLKRMMAVAAAVTRSRKFRAAVAALLVELYALAEQDHTLALVVAIVSIALLLAVALIDWGKGAQGMGPGEGEPITGKVAGAILSVLGSYLARYLAQRLGRPDLEEAAALAVAGTTASILLLYGFSSFGLNARQGAAAAVAGGAAASNNAGAAESSKRGKLPPIVGAGLLLITMAGCQPRPGVSAADIALYAVRGALEVSAATLEARVAADAREIAKDAKSRGLTRDDAFALATHSARRYDELTAALVAAETVHNAIVAGADERADELLVLFCAAAKSAELVDIQIPEVVPCK